MITQVLGDIWLSRGMKSLSAVDFTHLNLATVISLFSFLFSNFWIWLAVIFLVTSLILYLGAISRLDLSFVLPIHALSYVLNAVFAVWILGEQVPLTRWLGIFAITFGVMLVSVTKAKTTMDFSVNSRIVPAFFLPLGLVISKTWLAVFIISFADATGDILMAKGMKQVTNNSDGRIWKTITRVIGNRNILGGVLSQATAFGAMIAALSWADISLIRPASALTYIISMLGAKFILNEKLAKGRLVGISMIALGVLFLAEQ